MPKTEFLGELIRDSGLIEISYLGGPSTRPADRVYVMPEVPPNSIIAIWKAYDSSAFLNATFYWTSSGAPITWGASTAGSTHLGPLRFNQMASPNGSGGFNTTNLNMHLSLSAQLCRSGIPAGSTYTIDWPSSGTLPTGRWAMVIGYFGEIPLNETEDDLVIQSGYNYDGPGFRTSFAVTDDHVGSRNEGRAPGRLTEHLEISNESFNEVVSNTGLYLVGPTTDTDNKYTLYLSAVGLHTVFEGAWNPMTGYAISGWIDASSVAITPNGSWNVLDLETLPYTHRLTPPTNSFSPNASERTTEGCALLPAWAIVSPEDLHFVSIDIDKPIGWSLCWGALKSYRGDDLPAFHIDAVRIQGSPIRYRTYRVGTDILVEKSVEDGASFEEPIIVAASAAPDPLEEGDPPGAAPTLFTDPWDYVYVLYHTPTGAIMSAVEFNSVSTWLPVSGIWVGTDTDGTEAPIADRYFPVGIWYRGTTIIAYHDLTDIKFFSSQSRGLFIDQELDGLTISAMPTQRVSLAVAPDNTLIVVYVGDDDKIYLRWTRDLALWSSEIELVGVGQYPSYEIQNREAMLTFWIDEGLFCRLTDESLTNFITTIDSPSGEINPGHVGIVDSAWRKFHMDVKIGEVSEIEPTLEHFHQIADSWSV